jgi:nucleotide-binding universal stress UspA family protein
MKKILFPSDLSASSAKALDYAVQFAENHGATIDVLTIYNLPIDSAGNSFPRTWEPLLQEKKEAVEKELEALISAYPSQVFGQLFVEYGLFIYQEVVDFAEKGNYDIILMGTRGETNNLDKILGNITSHTMMQAKCPVLAIPPDSKYTPILKIGFAADMIHSDQNMLDNLTHLGAFIGASIHVVHVNTHPATNSQDSPNVTIIQNNSIQEGIDQFIAEYKIDVLALFIPKRRIWERLFHSSFSKKMALHTKIPLLTFRQ